MELSCSDECVLISVVTFLFQHPKIMKASEPRNDETGGMRLVSLFTRENHCFVHSQTHTKEKNSFGLLQSNDRELG